MIQFNLLPDVKLQYIKARRLKRMMSVVATVVTLFALTCALLLFLVVNVLQAKHLSDLNRDIKKDTTKLANTPELDKILTIQNQLNSLPDLHAVKPVSSRIFGYVSQLTPSNVSIASIGVDFGSKTITFTGSGDTLSSVNTFVDTLKFAEYQKKGDTTKTPAFSHVVLGSFDRGVKSATYTINVTFDEAIFDAANEITLIIPNQITTRSETEKPLYQPLPTDPNKKAGQ